jgi:transposase-like protein
MAKQHRRFEPADKIKILREHLLDGRPLSEVCEKYSIAPTQFYQCQKALFENGAAAFAPPKPGREYGLENKVKQFTRKLAHKDEVIAEVVEHNAWLPRDAWLTPAERQAILAARDAKLAAAREARKALRKAS